jgi:predicted dehydrogenase
MERRNFVKYTAAAGASLMLHPFSSFAIGADTKIKVALVGTGSRGSGFWGRDLAKNFPNLEFVGLCDINPGRVEFVKKYMNASCPSYTSVDAMLKEIKADYIIVTTVDSTHDEVIVKALNAGFNVITEKPMTTDELVKK